MILKRATHDFESLIKRINVQKDFEKCDIEHRYVNIASDVFVCTFIKINAV